MLLGLLVPVEGAGIVDFDADAFGIHDRQHQLRTRVAVDGGQLDRTDTVEIGQALTVRHADHRTQAFDRLTRYVGRTGAIGVQEVEIVERAGHVDERQLFHAGQGVDSRIVRTAFVRVRYAARRRFRRIEFVRRRPALGLRFHEGGVTLTIRRRLLEVLQEHVGADIAGFHGLVVIEIGVDVRTLEQRADVGQAVFLATHHGADGLRIVGRFTHRAILAVVEAAERTEAF